ncbi:hypothetical protein ACFVR2_15720 [Gottfriedia sp. NPDC057991]|uniref:hypothetical protein n=1 Tax=Gottfriedia sp. NPDC057991 TaxID=3346298 RepID=UPI0036DEDB48
MLDEMRKFEKGFPDGVFIEPNRTSEPKVKVKALYEYCRKKGLKPKDLTEKEREQFLVYE